MASIIVSNSSQLLSALSSANGGDTIILNSGDYGTVNFSNLKFGSDVTIKSATAQGATFDAINITNTTNLRIDSVHVDSPSNTGRALVNIENSQGIDIVNSQINGKVDTVYPIGGPTFGIYVDDGSSNIRVANNNVHDVLNGMAFFGAEKLSIVGNTVNRIGGDAFKFSNVDTVLIENNTGPTHLYNAADSHADFMQFQGGASSNVMIRGNVFIPQNDVDVQGIFVAGDGGHTNITITQNIIYTGMTNGILVTDGHNVQISYNTVINAINDDGASRIIAPGADVQHNIFSGNKGEVLGTNISIQHTDDNGKYYYDGIFKSTLDGSMVTLADLAPVAGSVAVKEGAYIRIMELLSGGGGTTPTPTPPPTTTTPTPDSGDFTAIYKLLGDTEFSGKATDIITVAHKAAFATDEGSIAFSFNADNVTAQGGLISKDADGYTGGGNHFSSWVKNGALFVRFEDTDSRVDFKVGNIRANQEYDVLATFEDHKVGLYVDGKLIGTKDFTMDWTANKVALEVGGLGYTDSHSFDGTISDVSIFDHVIAPQDYNYFT